VPHGDRPAHSASSALHLATTSTTVGFAFFMLTSRWRRALDQAVDDHVMLLAIKSQTLQGGRSPEFPLEEKLRMAIADVLQSLDEDQVADLGFGVSVRVSAAWARLFVGRHLNSPTFALKELSLALRAWRCFRKADERQPGHTGGGHSVLDRAPPTSPEMVEMWQRIRQAYLDAWANHCPSVCQLAVRIDGLAAQQAGRRQRQWERLEAVRMTHEEHFQRRIDKRRAAQDRRTAELAQRRRERQEQQQMHREDHLSCRCMGRRHVGFHASAEGKDQAQRRSTVEQILSDRSTRHCDDLGPWLSGGEHSWRRRSMRG